MSHLEPLMENLAEPQAENHKLRQKFASRPNTPAFFVLCVSDVQSILERLGSDRTLLKESVLIGCSEQNQVQFCLDVGENTLNAEYCLLQWKTL